MILEVAKKKIFEKVEERSCKEEMIKGSFFFMGWMGNNIL